VGIDDSRKEDWALAMKVIRPLAGYALDDQYQMKANQKILDTLGDGGLSWFEHVLSMDSS
jgi:hypothetical protein